MKHETQSTENIIVPIPHSQLKPSDLNPRKQKRDESALKELAENIFANGVLHNLTARPKGKGYEVAVGEGRYLAVEYLLKQKRLPKDYPLPVSVKELSDLAMLELATSENVQRTDMHPVDEAKAFSDMVELGGEVDSIALKMGMSAKTVQQRLAIATKLTPQVQQALLEDKINLAQAQQLTAASSETQEEVLKEILNDGWDNWTADDIKNFLKYTQMPVSNAIFKKDLYKGEYSNNLFDDGQKTFFLDSEQAKRLQLEAIENKRAKLATKWAWVEVVKSDEYRAYQYEEGETIDPTKQGVLIVYQTDTMKVQIVEGVVKRDVSSRSSTSTTAEKKPSPPYTKALLAETHHIKTRALQTELSKSHRHCLILNVMGLLGCDDVKIRTDRPQWKDFKTEHLETGFAPHLKALTKLFKKNAVQAYPPRLHGYNRDVTKLYRYLKDLADDDLHELFNLLTASVFGSWYGYDPYPGDSSLPLAVAKDLNIDMTRHFTLTEDFLEGYRRTGLLEVLKDLGIGADFSSVQAKGIREHILKQTKDKNYLPQLVKFSPVTKTVPLEDEDEALEAA
jgi:ParB family transcriptional regulator, chromosome partitioning protein